jgi:hypothetical protein
MSADERSQALPSSSSSSPATSRSSSPAHPPSRRTVSRVLSSAAGIDHDATTNPSEPELEEGHGREFGENHGQKHGQSHGQKQENHLGIDGQEEGDRVRASMMDAITSRINTTAGPADHQEDEDEEDHEENERIDRLLLEIAHSQDKIIAL